MNPTDEALLRFEFNGEEGSFFLQLRCEARWDDDRFQLLVQAMERCAEGHAGSEALPRWLAEGFWYMDTFVPEQVRHEAFQRQNDAEFYRTRCERLHCAAYWFFTGERA